MKTSNNEFFGHAEEAIAPSKNGFFSDLSSCRLILIIPTTANRFENLVSKILFNLLDKKIYWILISLVSKDKKEQLMNVIVNFDNLLCPYFS